MKKNVYHVAFNLLALSALIYISVDIFYRTLCFRLTETRSLEMAETRPPNPVHHVSRPLNAFDIIVDRNIFGSAGKALQGETSHDLKKEEIENLEPTSLKISLLGTVTGSEQYAWAVIEETSKRTQGLYRVGDPIQNAVVQKILRGKVVLRVGEKDEILAMDKTEKGQGRTTPPIIEAESGDTITVGRSDIKKSLRNVNKLLTQVRIRPHLRGGKPDGFVLSHIKSDSIFTRLGLKKGDIVKRIDGKEINTPEDAFSFYKALESGSSLSLEVSRGGRLKTMNYRFE